MSVARAGHTAILLNNGMVLIAGGYSGSAYLSTAELYNPATGTFTATGRMRSARSLHIATLLNSGKVLLTGGYTGGIALASSAELYDPSTGTFTATPNMHNQRANHTATLLGDGTVLIAGGQAGFLGSSVISQAELYNPSTNTFITVGNMTAARAFHSATLLQGGKVLIAGGRNSGSTSQYSSAELYDPLAHSFSATGSMNAARELQRAISMNGIVLLAGGWNGSSYLSSAELYDAASGTFTLTGSMSVTRRWHTATLLNDGSVLVAGGENTSSSALSSAEVFSFPSGSLDLKYVILAVTYAPPGQRSTATYGSTTMMGTSTSLAQTFINSTSVSASTTTGGIFGVGSGTTTTTASHSFTQESDTSSSISLNKTSTLTDIVPGPASSAVGIDHDFDLVWVWLNPKVNLMITSPTKIEWTGYSYNLDDPAAEMDIIPLYVTWLKNPSTIPTNVASILARTWDTSGVSGLTTADYAAILARDPFADPSYTIPPGLTTSPDHRFDLQVGETFTYEPPPSGGQPITETFSSSYQMTTTSGQGAQDTYDVEFSVDRKFTGNFGIQIGVELKSSTKTTWANKWSELTTQMVGQTAGLSITGPATSDNYTGPTDIQVWKDNVYGTFMFYPVQ
ncbi:MAG: hypothetical protein LAN36_02125 [Acidobacteriia bacterium]|nr:hypothetical protein [Terriglobia bacterium]